MKITCPKCKARLTLPDEKLKPEGTRFKCSKCGTSLFYKGKGKEAPKNSTSALPSPSLPSTEQPPPPFSVSERQQMDFDRLPSPDLTDSGDIKPMDVAAESRGILEKKEKPEIIEAVAETPKKYSAPGPGGGQRVVSRKAVLTGAAAGILVLVLAAIYFFYSQNMTMQDQVRVPNANKGPATAPATVQDKASLPQGGSPGGTPAGPTPAGTVAEQLSSPMTEEKAIELVKRSETLLRRTSVESIVTKWAEENAAKYKVVGWQAKKKDEQKYLVSFTAMDGDTPKGFYFEVDAQSGAIQTFTPQNTELQKK